MTDVRGGEGSDKDKGLMDQAISLLRMNFPLLVYLYPSVCCVLENTPTKYYQL